MKNTKTCYGRVMRHLTSLLTWLTVSALSSAQYSATGPKYFSFPYFLKTGWECKQTIGAETEPCPWTFPFDVLGADESFITYQVEGYVGPGTIITVLGLRITGQRTQTFQKLSTNTYFARVYKGYVEIPYTASTIAID
jgi:hypothetical protein